MNNSIAGQPRRTALHFSGCVGYAVAVVAVTVATLGRLALDPALGDNYPFVTYFVAVAVVAWFGRTPPAVATLAASGLLTFYLFVPPRYSFATPDPAVLLGVVLFLMVAGVIVAMSHAMRVARSRAEHLLAEVVGHRDELQRAADDRAEQAERLRITLASIGDAVISTDADGHVTYLNAVAESLTGWTNADAAGEPLTRVFHILNESTRLPVGNPALRALKEGMIVGLASRTVLISKDGTERPIDDSVAPIRSASGELVGSVLVFRDISEKKRLEGERREAQERVVATLESVTDGFIRYDRDWRIVYANAEAERINQLPRSEMLGRVVWELFPAVVGTILETELRRAMADRVTVEFENHYEPFGRWYALKGYPTADGGLTTFIRDVTEQKVHQEALAASEARLRRVFESNVVGMIRWDLDRSLILDANDEFLRMTGYTRDDVAAGRLNFRDMTPADWTARNEDGIRTIRAEGHAAPYEKEYFRKDGSRVPLIIAGTRFDDSPSEGMSLLIDISDRKRAEQEVARLAAESERQRRLYETVLTNTPDFVYVFSLDHRVLYANDALIRMWGRGHDGAIGKTFLEIGYEPWHAEMHDREIDTVRETKKPIRGEVAFTGTNGRRQYDYIFVPVLGADGEVEAVAGTTRDVTERHEAEADRGRLLRSVEAERGRLADVFRQAPAFLCVVRGPDHVFELANDRYYQLVGRRDLLGRPVREALPEVADQGFVGLLDGVYRTGEPFVGAGVQVLLARQSGQPTEERYVDFVYQALRDPDRTVTGVVTVGVDVTARHQAETSVSRLAAEAERERRLFAAVLSNTPDFIYTFDLEGRFVYVNAPLLALWGKGIDEAVGRTFHDLDYPPALADRLHRQIRQVIDTRQPVRDETPYTGHMGERQYEYIFVPVLGGAGGAVEAVAGSTRDITDRKRAEEELRRLAADLSEADRRKDEFLATLAHELRNPLAPIRNGLQVIKLAGANGTVERARSMMERQLTQMVRLVDDLLDVSRITRGKLDLRTERVEVGAFIAAAVETSRPLIEQAGHALAVTVPDDPVFVDGDAARLAQVVSNLLTNSAKYTHRGGHIRLEVARRDGTVSVSVTDDGIGIPPAMLGRVFEMFVQVDRTLEKTTGGLGIGLSLVKGLVEMQGGTIEARSEGEGRGSQFVLTLPAAAPVAGGAGVTSGPAEEVVPSSLRRILVVDDNADSADSLGQLLEMLGNEVRTAYDGEAGVAAAGAFRPAVVLCDIGMPKLNGYEACRRIRAEPWGKGMVLVALTGWGQEDDRQKSTDAGFDHHLVKPVETAALMTLLAGLPSATA